MTRDWTQEEFNITEDTPVSDYEKEIQLLKTKIDTLEKQLNIAVKALITYKNLRYDGTVTNYEYIAKEALAIIKGD